MKDMNNSLPPEIHLSILGRLDLDDLARLCRVSRSLRKRAEHVLSTIRCIFCPQSNWTGIDECSLSQFLLRNTAPHPQCRANLTQNNVASFLRFVAAKCPRVSWLVAEHLFVRLEDIAALAPRLTNFALDKILVSGENLIDAKSLAVNFINLQHFALRFRTNLCAHQVRHEYSLISTNSFAMYYDCDVNDHCQVVEDVRSIDSLLFIQSDAPLTLHELRSSSLHSLQHLSGRLSKFDSEHTPPLPNLRTVEIHCDHEDLNGVIRFLHRSTKLLIASFHGEVDRATISAFQPLFSNCPALQLFSITGISSGDHIDDDVLVGDDQRCSLDLSQQRKSSLYFTLENFWLPVDVEIPAASLSFGRMKAFSHPIEITFRPPCQDLVYRVIELCPQVECLTLYCDLTPEDTQLIPVLESALVKTDVRNIILVSSTNAKFDESFVRSFFEVINKYSARDFCIGMRCEEETSFLRLIHSVVKRPFTFKFDTDGLPIVQIEPDLSSIYIPRSAWYPLFKRLYIDRRL